jgi:transaldolase
MTDRLQELSAIGVSIWLDDLDRSRLVSGGLRRLVAEHHVVGVTTNPSIFAKAIAGGADTYAPQLASLASGAADSEFAVRQMTTQDVREACDVLAPVAAATDGVDGRVSIEVDPRLAHDTGATIEQARSLWQEVGRPNLLVKIPGTVEGLPAVTQAISEGISVNVTLIFGVERYEAVLDAWASGLEQRLSAGLQPSGVGSVASFFVSRVDTAVDALLDKVGTERAAALRGRAGIANARLAWAAFERFSDSARCRALQDAGATLQRPLWASTGVKDPAYPDDMYVAELAGPGCVNTMPEPTLQAVAAHGRINGDTLTGREPESRAVFDALADLGIDMAQVCVQLEAEGVEKFEHSWEDLLMSVEQGLSRARGET